MLTRNLDHVDRVLRFALAFWWLGPWAPSFMTDWANTIVVIIGWIALIESFLGFCWLHKVLGIDKHDKGHACGNLTDGCNCG